VFGRQIRDKKELGGMSGNLEIKKKNRGENKKPYLSSLLFFLSPFL
jgi:hypothetical protein